MTLFVAKSVGMCGTSRAIIYAENKQQAVKMLNAVDHPYAPRWAEEDIKIKLVPKVPQILSIEFPDSD